MPRPAESTLRTPNQTDRVLLTLRRLLLTGGFTSGERLTELDLVSRTVARRGQKIELLPREFQVLEYLVRNQGQVVPRAMLLQHVWDLHFDPMTNIIDVYVGRVRRKVDGQQAYPLIHTVRGVGFCIRAPD